MPNFYAITTPGLESIAANELKLLGANVGEQSHGGIAWSGTWEDALRVHLYARTPNRILWRIASFRARAFGELARKTAQIDWSPYFHPNLSFSVKASTTRSRLYHTGRIVQDITQVIAKATGAAPVDKDPQSKPSQPQTTPQQLQVRLANDTCTLSLDMSGELLHRRGYRQATWRAPLRETIAASLLQWAGWDPTTPLLDPMCGSGTFPIEAAQVASHHAPGLHRSFSFLSWPSCPHKIWDRLLQQAQQRSILLNTPGSTPLQIFGSDRSPKALEAARANALRASAEQAISWRCCDVGAIEVPAQPGLMVCNPPYGARIGSMKAIRPVYQRLGEKFRAQEGWSVLLIWTRKTLYEAFCRGLAYKDMRTMRFHHGGLKVNVSLAKITSQSASQQE